MGLQSCLGWLQSLEERHRPFASSSNARGMCTILRNGAIMHGNGATLGITNVSIGIGLPQFYKTVKLTVPHSCAFLYIIPNLPILPVTFYAIYAIVSRNIFV